MRQNKLKSVRLNIDIIQKYFITCIVLLRSTYYVLTQ